MAHFGSVDRIRTASREELLRVEGIYDRAAQAIIGYFKKAGSEPDRF